MAAPDFAALVQNFPPRSTAARAALLEFARMTPLVYGSWKSFKKLFKLAESAVFDGGGDLELLAVLAARIDGVRFSATLGRFRPALATELFNEHKAENDTVAVRVGGRNKWDYDGWRIEVRTKTRKFLHSELGAPVYWDFQGTYGGLGAVHFNGNVLSVKRQWGQGETQVDLSDPAFPHLMTAAPSSATFQYLKRRVRRIGRRLAKEKPELYAAWALQFLRAGGEKLDPNLQWAAMDILFANSPRWQQKLAGRGPYEAQKVFVLRRREERAPELWDRNLDAARELFSATDVPLEANEMALKILRANGQELPDLSIAAGLRFLNGSAPLLSALARRELSQRWLDGEDVPGEVVAALILRSGRREREFLLQRFDAWADAPRQMQLGAQLQKALENQNLSERRRGVAAALLLNRFENHLSDEIFWKYLPLFATLGDPEKLLARVRRAAQNGEMNRLQELAKLPEIQRETLVAAFSEAFVVTGALKADVLIALINTGDVAQGETGWQFLAALGLSPDILRELWRPLLKSDWRFSSAQRTAFASKFAGQTLVRAAFPADDFLTWLNTFNYFAWWSPEFFEAIIETLPVGERPRRMLLILHRLSAETRDAIWPRYRNLAQGFEPTTGDLTRLLGGYGTSVDIPEFWQFLAGSQVSSEALGQHWRKLFPSALPEAIPVFLRATIPGDELVAWLRANQNLTPEFFRAAFGRLSGASQVEAAIGATPAQWDLVKERLRAALNTDAALTVFWRGVWQALRDENAELQARILDDEAIGATFERIPAQAFADFITSGTAAHEPFVLRWLNANLAKAGRDLALLVAAATDKLPSVRALGIARVSEIGLDVPLALRLLESGLPEPFEMARSWFESQIESATVADRIDFVLALCDSPARLVRELGVQHLESGVLELDARVLSRLAEHSDPILQDWLARQLKTTSLDTRPVRDFDAAVLRSRGRSRRAKESVKTRVQSNGDAQVLVDVARGATSRDREWALQQIARRVLAGEAIEGVAECKIAGH